VDAAGGKISSDMEDVSSLMNSVLPTLLWQPQIAMVHLPEMSFRGRSHRSGCVLPIAQKWLKAKREKEGKDGQGSLIVWLSVNKYFFICHHMVASHFCYCHCYCWL